MFCEKLSIEELDDMSSMERYIEVLLGKFPKPINQKELAKETSVTKSAISKIRDRIVPLCDIEVLGYEKKLLLNSNTETFTKLLFFFFSRLKPQIFLKSNYLKSVVKSWNVHEKLTKHLANLSYSRFFNEDDTNKIVEIIFYNLSTITFPQLHFNYHQIKRAKADAGLLMLFFAYFPVLGNLSSNFDGAIFENEKELNDLLRLRDKAFYFVLHNFKKGFQNWEVVTNIKEDDTKKVYVEAYLKVVDYYARKYANDFTSKAATRAKKKGIGFKSQYFEIGALFKPHNECRGDICHNGTKEETHLSTPGSGESPLPANNRKSH